MERRCRRDLVGVGMTEQVFTLPDLGEGLTEAQIVEWKVQEGDTVSVDQFVVEVETAKALVEVPIPFAGRVVTLHGQPGATLVVGDPLITVDAATGEEDGIDATDRPSTDTSSGAVLIGYGTDGNAHTSRRRRAGSQQAAPQPRPVTAPSPAVLAQQPARVISPVVRELARRHAVDVTSLHPSGPGRVIRRTDVEAMIPATGTDRGNGMCDADQRIPLAGLRKVIADKMTTSHREIPKATTWVDVDATGLINARTAINATVGADDKISLLALLARLALAALAHYPELNATVDTDSAEIIQYVHVNLGIAAQTGRGLLVPVIERADTLDTIGLSRQLTETTALARDGKLPPARMTGGTFTLNNYGVLGSDGATPIINHPEAAILGIGRIIDKPWVFEGQLAIRKVAQLSMTFDHRVCDGGTAGGFLRLFADYVENPVAALGRL
jgi:pyruvate dehydrogenase E2 component (dihydrolipoamide acetyltransferase)